MLVHAILHWPQEMNLDWWPFAMDHAIYLWNHQLNRAPGILPVKHFTGQIFENYDFLNTLGCRSLAVQCMVFWIPHCTTAIRYLSGFLQRAKDNTWEFPCDTGAQLVAYHISTLGKLAHNFMWHMIRSLPPCQMPNIPVWQMPMISTLTLFLIPSQGVCVQVKTIS
jgi:hypothetical protein